MLVAHFASPGSSLPELEAVCWSPVVPHSCGVFSSSVSGCSSGVVLLIRLFDDICSQGKRGLFWTLPVKRARRNAYRVKEKLHVHAHLLFVWTNEWSTKGKKGLVDNNWEEEWVMERTYFGKTGGLSGLEAFMSNKSYENFHNVLSQRLHTPQHLHNIRFCGLPRGIRESSLDLFKIEGRIK